MADHKPLPYAIFSQDEEFNHLRTPEVRLNFEILLRAIEDATLLCNRKYRASAVNWFNGVTKNPPVTFAQVCASLELSDRTIKIILARVTYSGKLETKGKSWRTRVC